MSERKMHYFEFHFQKIIAATKGWRDDEFGAFVKLLIEQFDRGYVPDDPEEIGLIITTYKKNWPRLAKKFTAPSEAGQLRNAFMITIRNTAHEKSAINAVNGKKGAEEKKRKKSERLSDGLPNAKRMDQQGLSQPVTSNQEPENTVVEKVRSPWFEMFRRAAGVHINDEILEIEIGKFVNKYPNSHPNQSGGLVNTWVSRIGFEPIKAEEPAVRRMVI